jgi:prolyl oligopeptidase
VTLSRGGADAAVIREFDLERLAWVEGGFTIPESKSFANWVDRDTLYVGADWGPESWTSSGYPREVRRWKRGTPIEAAEPVFAGEKSDVSVVAWRDFTPGSEREWVERGTTFYSSKLYLVQAGNLVVVPKPDDAIATSFRDWLLLELRSDLMEGARTYLRGSLLAIRLDAFLSGDRAFDVLFEPTARTSLAEVRSTRNRLIIRTLDNVRGKVEILAPGKGGWTRKAMAGLPTLGNVSVWGADPYQNDEVLFTVTDYVTPTTLSWQDLGKGRSKAMKSLPAFFEARGLAVTQHEATSQDGTRVPYFQVARSDAPKGPQPTLLYGYGGFEVSMLPNYSGVVGASWLEKGGVYVVANIRGGGEFGPSWHQAALKANRPRAYEDFAAVARDLVARGITDKDHLGTMGGSNGGLLMGNMTVSYPELFEAVVCSVPLLDMKRYHLLLAGASWMGEYGDPEQPGEWDFIQHFSPYQLVRRDGEYPRVLFMTSTRDDRVHPGHARKMAARMQEYGKNILYFENIEGGHGGAADNGQAARQWALAYTFLWRELQ